MNPAGNLFIKTFIAFWVVTCAILGTWMISASYFDAQPPELREKEPRGGGRPHRFILRYMYDLQHGDADDLARTVADAREQHAVEIYLLDSAGADLLGRAVPTRVSAVAGDLEGGRRRAMDHSPEGRLIAHGLYRRDSGPIRAVFLLPNPRAPLLSFLGGSPGLRITLAVLVSGLVCFVLSRLMTRRIRTLQRASRRLAGGELDTRVEVREKGGDETDELARDFNSMAGQLQARVQAQKRLLSDVSHELRSPLARLRIALALAQEDDAGTPTHLARIEREAERLEELIGQLLSSQARDAPLDTQVDLLALLRQLCEDAGFEGQERGVTIKFQSPLDSATLVSRGDLLQKTFDNLLRNALAHSPRGSAVQVELRLNEGNWVATVADRGPGIPQDEIDAVFDEFYRVDSARARESGGYGLGLSIARRAVEQHGGTIRAENTAPGLRVTVALPAGPAEGTETG